MCPVLEPVPQMSTCGVRNPWLTEHGIYPSTEGGKAKYSWLPCCCIE